VILIGMGIVGTLLLVFVFSPFSIFGGDDNGPGATQSGGQGRPAKVPEGYEALSRVFNSLEKPRGTNGPYALTVNLIEPVTDERNLGLYTNRNGTWERIAPATLINNGTAASGQVGDMPANVAVLRRTTSAAQVAGSLPAGAQPEQAALEVISTLSPVDYTPAPDGAVTGTASVLPNTNARVTPTVRALSQTETDAVNTILASPALREAHISAVVQLATQQGNSGVVLDYQRINPARRADFTALVSGLADRLHQSNRTLALTLPTPVKTGVSWDTGAYDWEGLARLADTLRLAPEPDPSVYHDRMEDVLTFLKSRVDLSKVVLLVTRQSYEKGTDGLRALSLNEGLSLASTIEVRTTTITPNSSVVIVGKNIFQDDGASGLRWDDKAFAVSFSYPGRGGQRTVWLENSLSLAFKIDLARRFGLGGIAVDDVSQNPQAAAIWEPLRTYMETGTVKLAQPNGVMLRPTWQFQAGQNEPGTRGNVVWKAPPQPGGYEVSLIVSDGVIRAQQKLLLQVAATPGATTTTTPTVSPTPALRP
jgi:spore germination protein YaaH